MALLFNPHLSTVISSIYGAEGSKELRTYWKKLRLGKECFRGEGHPASEHILVPKGKVITLPTADFATAFAAKAARYKLGPGPQAQNA